jgi:hypothetical protein
MWIATVHGFYSAVCARRQDGKVDESRFVVRARRRNHLVQLKERFDSLANVQIISTPGRDYPFRIVVAKNVWVEIMSKLISEMNYDNFKIAVAHGPVGEDQAFVTALNRVWLSLAQLPRD